MPFVRMVVGLDVCGLAVWVMFAVKEVRRYWRIDEECGEC